MMFGRAGYDQGLDAEEQEFPIMNDYITACNTKIQAKFGTGAAVWQSAPSAVAHDPNVPTSPDPVQQVSVQPNADGTWSIPVVACGRGSTLRSAFVIPPYKRMRRKTSETEACAATSPSAADMVDMADMADQAEAAAATDADMEPEAAANEAAAEAEMNAGMDMEMEMEASDELLGRPGFDDSP